MRRTLLLIGLVVAGCEPEFSDRPNEIVFGISQSQTGAISADYDFIGIGNHGGSTAAAFRDGDGDGACWFENLTDRLGKAHVDDGFAYWTGGTLPAEGLLIRANQTEPARQATWGWQSTDTISWYAEGFAMPPMGRVTMQAPLVELALGAISPAPDAANAIALTPTTPVSVAWTPPVEVTKSRVLVTLETATANVRCFNWMDSGSTTIPAKWIAQLFPSGTGAAGADGANISGTLTIASHRQATMIGDGAWIVYVVATSVHRDIAFTGTR